MNTDFIRVSGLSVFARHGVFAEEKEKGQTFVVNGKFYYDMETAAKSDSVEDALNYAELCQFLQDTMQEKSFDLIEAAAEALCRETLLHFDQLTQVELELCKPNAPIGLPFENVSVNMTRGWHTAYIALGSNLGDSRTYVMEAIEKLKGHPSMKDLRASQLISTRPYGVENQPAFVNGAVEVRTLLNPEALLTELHIIESQANRTREIHWGPRTLDLDILLYDDLVYESEDLIIPHVDMENRDFVLKPMAELAPNLRHPLLKKTMTQLLKALPKKPRMVIFDVDGTLIDSSEGITKSVQYTLKHYGIEEPDLNKLLPFIGPPLADSFEKYYGFSREQAVESCSVYRERYEPIGMYECKLYPGVEDCLRKLKEAGYLIGMGSSKPETTCIDILTHLGIVKYFDELCGATKDGRISSKEEVLKELFRRHPDLPKTDMVLVGDTLFDIEGANLCNIKSIGVSFGFGNLEEMRDAGAMTIVDSMEELAEFVEREFPL